MRINILLSLLVLPFVMVSCASIGDEDGLSANENTSSKILASADGSPDLSTRSELLEFNKFTEGPYLVGPGDILRLKSLSKDFQDEQVKVNPDGTINITGSGIINVTKKTIPVIEHEINDLLLKRYDNVEIKVVLDTAINRKILVLGDVRSPGLFVMDTGMTIMDVVAKAGGFSSVGGEPTSYLGHINIECRVIRDNGKSVWVDLNKVLFQNSQSLNLILKSNDILYVYKHF